MQCDKSLLPNEARQPSFSKIQISLFCHFFLVFKNPSVSAYFNRLDRIRIFMVFWLVVFWHWVRGDQTISNDAENSLFSKTEMKHVCLFRKLHISQMDWNWLTKRVGISSVSFFYTFQWVFIDSFLALNFDCPLDWFVTKHLFFCLFFIEYFLIGL